VEPLIRAGVLSNFRLLVISLGGDPTQLMQRAGVNSAALEVEGTYLHYYSYLRLLALAAQELQCPHFGLEMTRSASAETLGITGFIMPQAPTVGGAWETLSRVYRAHDTLGTVSSHISGSRVSMSYALPATPNPGRRQAFDAAAGISCNIMRQLCGPEWRPLELAFPFSEPVDLSVYDHLQAGGLQFGHHRYELFYDPEWNSHRISYGIPEMHSVLSDYVHSPVTGGSLTARERTLTLIRGLLPLGDCNVKQVARMMNISVRTLQSQLERERTGFKQLLEDVRREIALYHLRQGDMQLTQLAMVLGYSELSAFTRSFRRWYGTSPRGWQKSNR